MEWLQGLSWCISTTHLSTPSRSISAIFVRRRQRSEALILFEHDLNFVLIVTDRNNRLGDMEASTGQMADDLAQGLMFLELGPRVQLTYRCTK